MRVPFQFLYSLRKIFYNV